MGGKSVRRSSYAALSESRRFCSASLCDLRVTGASGERVIELFSVVVDPAGRIGLGPGDMSGRPPLRDVLDAVVVSLVLTDSLPCSTRDGCSAGARLLLTPSRPRFMMDAGVTGVMRSSSWTGRADDAVEAEERGEEGFLGGAGGGMVRSTGDDESVSFTELLR